MPKVMSNHRGMTDAEYIRMYFDPAEPKPQFFSTATEMAAFEASSGIAQPVPWPSGYAPALNTPALPPAAGAPLPKADVVVVTWTSAEASSLAALMTPGMPTKNWFEYTSNVAQFVPLVTGHKAPFNDNSAEMARYYHVLGLYYPITLVGRKVICLKSGLHMDYDGPKLPIVQFWKQVIAETGCELIITTGTGGAIGANVLLGDIVIADQTAILCKKQFHPSEFPGAPYATSPTPATLTTMLTPALLQPNAAKVAKSKLASHADNLPEFYMHGSAIASPTIVTTDFFGFDNTTNTNHLQDVGNVCEMGDVSLGLAISQLPQTANAPKWTAIRNASDPQVDGTLSPEHQDTWAGKIYKQYGGYTTAASVLASWAYICQSFPAPVADAPAALIAPAPAPDLQQSRQRSLQIDPAHRLMQIVASTSFVSTPTEPHEVPLAVAALTRHLAMLNVSYADAIVEFNAISYEDETACVQQLTLAHAAVSGASAFRGSYLLDGEDIVAKNEFA